MARMSAAVTWIRMWIYGLALVTLATSLHHAGGSTLLSAGAATALIAITALLLTHTVATAAMLRSGRAPIGVTLHARARNTGVLRQRDPDAPGRPRPRAPGISLSR
jgi:CHASE1-domain containing sensor protein